MLLSLALLPGPALSASTDAPGSSDPDDLPRYPGAWITDSAQLPEAARTFVLGSVERKRREVRIGESKRLQASLESVTYQLPSEVNVDDVVSHYQGLLSGRIVYQCSGRDCGRSNEWANTVFEKSDLYGPDAQQRYLAADLGDALIAVYIIRRGNRRVRVHLARYLPLSPVDLLPAPQELDALVLRGRAVLSGIQPAADGTLSAAALERLQAVGEQLAELSVPSLFVVCRLHGESQPAPPAERRPRRPEIPDQSDRALALVERSRECAATAVDALQVDQGPKLLPFGVGPLAPLGPRPRSGLELILPTID